VRALSSVIVVNCQADLWPLIWNFLVLNWRHELRVLCLSVYSCGEVVESSFVILDKKEATPSVEKWLTALRIQVTSLR
jgi:hypothetical protein